MIIIVIITACLRGWSNNHFNNLHLRHVAQQGLSCAVHTTCLCPSQSVEHLETTNGLSTKSAELLWAGVMGMGMSQLGAVDQDPCVVLAEDALRLWGERPMHRTVDINITIIIIISIIVV